MPLKVNELVIQAKFDSEVEADANAGKVAGGVDLELFREEIIRECMEKVEEYLRKQERR
ncbi:hypothetical protein C900_02998 [Fulvivirga imtechensis AK7]|uniref:Uncharacterized protein n=1 Tax=Fulvivirga imtechensis AK7 TaxID=1237149 RepID=L8JUG7_9BACT|nr:DUF5908 family protein [Fulvivirga imtechensis]ELR71194.1 hypothetical protein C900_02998 [Fulvivirga imtechensis AK7]